MQELKKYIVTIQNENCDLFDRVLDGIKLRSDSYHRSRLSTIVPMNTKTAYEVSLTVEEAVIMVLSCPGECRDCNEEVLSNIIQDYTDEVCQPR